MSALLRIAALVNCAMLSLVFVNNIFLRPTFRTLFIKVLLFVVVSIFVLLVVQFRRRAKFAEEVLIVDGTLGIAGLFFDFVLMGLMGE